MSKQAQSTRPASVATLVALHKRHIIGSVTLSCAIFVALMATKYVGIGGISIKPGLIIGGFVLAEAGRSLTCFGQNLSRTSLEYGGVFIQGLAWWIWSLNLDYLKDKHGVVLCLHLLVPAALMGALPTVFHYAMRESFQLRDTIKSRPKK